MIWSWDLSATLGWANGSSPGSWIQRCETTGLLADAGGGTDLAAPDADAEDCARPLGSIHSWFTGYTHMQTEIAMCNPGMLIAWQPRHFTEEQNAGGDYVDSVRLHVTQLVRRPS